MRRLLILIAGVLILIAVAVPTAAVYYLAFTQSGFEFIVSRIPHRRSAAMHLTEELDIHTSEKE